MIERFRPFKPTLLFLPGTLCDKRVWAAQTAALSTEWQCFSVDYRNQSSIGGMANVALNSAEGPVIPIGASMGGLVALEMWRLAPERIAALALFDTDPGADRPEKFAGRAELLARMLEEGMEPVVRRDLVPRYDAAQTNVAAFEIAVDMALALGVAAYAAQHAALASRQDYSALLAQIHVSALVVCGDDDGICPPALHERMAAAIANARLVQIPGGGHLPSLARPAETTEVLVSWLVGLLDHESVANTQR